MAEIYWLNALSGSFTNASDWSGGVVPGTADDAIIGAVGANPYTVTATAIEMVNSIQTTASATLSIASGFLGLAAGTGGGVNAGAIMIAAGATLSATGQITNTGTISVNGGTGSADLLTTSGVTFGGGGQIALGAGGKDVLGGDAAKQKFYAIHDEGNTISGAGTIGGSGASLSIGAGGVIDATGPKSLLVSVAGTTLANDGTMEATTGGSLTLSAGVIQNDASGIILASGGALNLQGVTTLSNSGLLEATGGGDLILNAGTIQNGTSGVILSTDGSAVTVQSTVLTGTLKASGSGTILVEGSDLGGVTTIGTINAGGVSLDGTLDNTGDLLLAGAMRASRGYLSGGGTMSLAPGSSIGDYTFFGYFTNRNNTIIDEGSIFGSGTDGLVFTNDAAGVVNAAGSANLTFGGKNDSVVNAGIIACTSTGGVTFGGKVRNTGTISVEAGTVVLGGSVTGEGIIQIDDATLIAKAAFNEFVVFTGSTGELELSKAQAYGGGIIGFSKKGATSLDLRDITFGGGTEATYVGGKAGGVLTVTDQTNTAHINMQGNFLGSTFNVASDGHGGVLITATTGKASAAPASGMPSAHRLVAAMAGLGAAGAGDIHPGQTWSMRAPLLAEPRVASG